MARNAKYQSMRRYYKKRYKKRYNNKYKFSKYNTYKNRSSADQAYQIYSLNKKLNRYVKQTKPETQIKEFNAVTIDSSSSYTTITNQSTDAKSWCVIPPEVFRSFSGKLARIKSISVRGFVTINYSAGTPTVCRLIFVASKARMEGMPVMTEIINFAPGDNTDFEQGPLNTGITANYKVLLDRSIVMSPSFYRSRTFKFKLTRFVNFRSEINFPSIPAAPSLDQQTFPTGSIFCIALFSNHDKIPGSSAYPAITLKDFRVKMAYVDQN